MPLSVDILKEHGLVYVRYTGHARTEETLEAFGKYMAHPDFAPGQKQFVDLTGLTGIDSNYPEIMAMQAKKAEAFLGGASETIIVYLAPNKISQTLSQMIIRSWEPFPSVVPIILENEADALAILGLRESSIADLLPTQAD